MKTRYSKYIYVKYINFHKYYIDLKLLRKFRVSVYPVACEVLAVSGMGDNRVFAVCINETLEINRIRILQRHTHAD